MPITKLKQALADLDWGSVAEQLHAKGYAHLPGLLDPTACAQLIQAYGRPELYRKSITMERHRYGQGEYRYFAYPLPKVVQTLRETIYPKLAPVANQWMEWLRLDRRFPATFAELQALCHQNHQTRPTALILKYGAGGYNALHQDLYGDIFFPMQLAICLNQPGKDFTGGEFVLVQQNPRAQSQAMVVSMGRGDAIVFTTNFRPVKSTRGYYRAGMRHGVSELLSGTRHTLGIIFHDAK